MSETVDSPLRLREFLGNHFVQWTTLLAFIENGISWALLFFFLRSSEAPINLRYNVYLGSDLNYQVPWFESYQITIFALIFLCINCMVAFFFFRRTDRFASHTLLLGGIFVQLFTLISSISIVLANI